LLGAGGTASSGSYIDAYGNTQYYASGGTGGNGGGGGGGGAFAIDYSQGPPYNTYGGGGVGGNGFAVIRFYF
jgi:hypothetical protein